MNLSNEEKEVLGFLYGKIGHNPKAGMGMRALQRHFAELAPAAFEQLCDGLIEKDLVANYFLDQLTFTPEGEEIARVLQGAPAQSAPPAPEDTPPPVNEHLVWDLSQMADYHKASQFVMQFRQSLCVYSGPVQQLYSNYEILVPRDNERKLTILPNPMADHDTFNFINPDAVVPTRIFIAPDRDGELRLLIPLNKGTWHPMPLLDGLNAVQEKMGDVPFLPVLTKGDLREQSPSAPVLHLHNILLQKITSRSEMELRLIRRVIQDNLGQYYGFKGVGKAVISL